MGMFTVNTRVIGANGLAEDIDALVDTGANRTALPVSLLRRLGVVPQEASLFRTATEELVELETGEALVEFDGRRKTVPIVFNSDSARPLLGAIMLETFHLAVDPVQKRLIPVPGELR